MKIIVLGIPYFAKKIASNLSDIESKHSYIALDTSGSLFDKLKYLWEILFCQTVYLIGGSTECGGALRLALLLNKKIVMHWVGTDVVNAQKAYKDKTLNLRLLNHSRHLCEVEWIQKELQDIHINAEIVQIAAIDTTSTPLKNLPNKFSILSYIGRGREEFYGMLHLISLAKAFPDIEIRVAGIQNYEKQLPSNITLLGWVKDMAAEYENCTLYLRLPEHDGLAFSVLEALSRGRHVGYSQDYPAAQFVPTTEALIDYVQKLLEEHKKGFLQVNKAGADFVKLHFNKVQNMAILQQHLCQERNNG